MIIAIHQPEFMPWLGFFDKMKRVDKYIIFDHVQFKKRYFENRNRVKFGDEAIWITLPVKSKGKYLQPINGVEIENSLPWQKKMWGTLCNCYSKTPYFEDFRPLIQSLLCQEEYTRLIDFNVKFIDWFRKVLEITTPMEYSSGLDVAQYRDSSLILEICLRTGASQYLCGPSGKDYLDIDAFKKAGVEIIWQDFKHPEYPQSGKTFIPYLSILDLVFNCGAGSKKVLFQN